MPLIVSLWHITLYLCRNLQSEKLFLLSIVMENNRTGPRVPEVYAKIAYHYKWIENITGQYHIGSRAVKKPNFFEWILG